MTIFSKIIQGEIPCYKITENEHFFAFLDIRPLKKGHTLLVPKEPIDYFFDIDDARLGEMMVFAKKIASAIKKAVPCTKVGISVIGLEVPHAHIHLVPIDEVKDLTFGQGFLTLSAEEMEQTALEIRKHLIES